MDADSTKRILPFASIKSIVTQRFGKNKAALRKNEATYILTACTQVGIITTSQDDVSADNGK
jgi:hypothetical protein